MEEGVDHFLWPTAHRLSAPQRRVPTCCKMPSLAAKSSSRARLLSWPVERPADAIENRRVSMCPVKWVCPVSTYCLPLSHGTSSQSNLFVL
jgi:hypothetical protein